MNGQLVSGWRGAMAMAVREWIRFFRQPSRVIGALGQPVLLWLLLGIGLGRSFQGAGGIGFSEYYLAGTIALILLFTAIFTTISIIEDRKAGFLQGVLAAPVPRWAIAAGKILGGGAIAWVQSLLFVLLAAVLGPLEIGSLSLSLIAFLALAAIAITALGMLFAWPMDSTQGFHAIMNLVLLPMWLLSGALFPIPGLTPDATWGETLFHWAMRVNPMSYVVAGIRQHLDPAMEATGWSPGPMVCWIALAAFALGLSTLAAVMVSKQAKGRR